MNSDENKTIPTALAGFISSFNIDWGIHVCRCGEGLASR